MLEYKTVSMYGSSDYCRGWNDAVKEMPKWISVKERMPAKGENVLLYIPEREGWQNSGEDKKWTKRCCARTAGAK